MVVVVDLGRVHEDRPDVEECRRLRDRGLERPERQDRGPKLRPVKPLSERPAEPYTVFIGNLSYDVTDESMTSYAEEKAGEGTVSAVRWITDRDSGEFKGAGYIDFATTDAVDAFVTLNGAVWMGRQLRVDYAVPKY